MLCVEEKAIERSLRGGFTLTGSTSGRFIGGEDPREVVSLGAATGAV